MEQLIKISDHNGKKAVSARELHAFLESKQQFSNWIQNRIEQYGFVENHDHEVLNNFIKNPSPSGGRPMTEYALSISCAKEISMVEGNEKGKQARTYFITCETLLKDIANGELAKEKKRTAVLKRKSDEILTIDRTISSMMKRRRLLVNEINTIIRTDSTQLELPFENTGIYFSVNEFPNRKK